MYNSGDTTDGHLLYAHDAWFHCTPVMLVMDTACVTDVSQTRALCTLPVQHVSAYHVCDTLRIHLQSACETVLNTALTCYSQTLL